MAVALLACGCSEDTPRADQPVCKGKTASVEWSLSKTGKPLEREAVIALRDGDGQPINDAVIEVLIDMPSMPMMHQVPKAVAEPAREPGTYRTRFTLEMAGEWAAQIEVKEPVQARVVKKFTAD